MQGIDLSEQFVIFLSCLTVQNGYSVLGCADQQTAVRHFGETYYGII